MDTILSENWGKSLISLNLVPANKSVLKVFQGLVSVLISDVRILILEVSDGRVPLYIECALCPMLVCNNIDAGHFLDTKCAGVAGVRETLSLLPFLPTSFAISTLPPSPCTFS